MIVIGVDVHKQSVTAVAIDQVGQMRDEKATSLRCVYRLLDFPAVLALCACHTTTA
jgi:hypothetical protein